jgi:hypothetical protein
MAAISNITRRVDTLERTKALDENKLVINVYVSTGDDKDVGSSPVVFSVNSNTEPTDDLSSELSIKGSSR